MTASDDHFRRIPNKVWIKKNIATVIMTGEAVISLNQASTFPKPEIVRKALVDHTSMANK